MGCRSEWHEGASGETTTRDMIAVFRVRSAVRSAMEACLDLRRIYCCQRQQDEGLLGLASRNRKKATTLEILTNLLVYG
jgi:hypothetical protein